jgi:hypothetical protein
MKTIEEQFESDDNKGPMVVHCRYFEKIIKLKVGFILEY